MSLFCTIIDKFKRKLSGRKGFTITEMLACTLILLLSTGLIVSTLTIGLNQFQARTRESEAVVLCDSLAMEVQEQLTWGEKFKIGADNIVDSFDSLLWKNYTCSIQKSSDGKLLMHLVNGDDSVDYPLVSDASYTGNGDLYVDQFSIKKQNDDGLLLVTIRVNSRKYAIQKAENTFTIHCAAR